MTQCIVDGCQTDVAKEGHELCYDHWKLGKEGKLFKCQKCGKPMDKDKPLCLSCYRAKDGDTGGPTLTATAIGEKVGLKADRINQIFAELGWIRHGKADVGWICLKQGISNGAVAKTHPQSGAPFVVWNKHILDNPIFMESVRALRGDKAQPSQTPPKKSEELNFRQKFPAEYRATDGHMVRSRAEVMIDNWLYVNDLTHAYERQVPIAEDLYCDFYLLRGRVYIEYWGMENDPAYAARKAVKKELYRKNECNLIELTDDDILHLDDVLPKKLLEFEIRVS